MRALSVLLRSSMGLNRHVAAGALAVLTCIWPTWTRAQTGGCAVAAHTDPPRQVLVCADGLTMTAERGADYRMLDRNRDGRPDAVEVRSRALLLELSAGNRRGSFQVLTPHAIASVRGTVWAVDVGPERTSVLVREGRVTVAPPRATEQVQLGPGQGVDVEPGRPLEVKQWSAERVARLLARFGR